MQAPRDRSGQRRIETAAQKYSEWNIGLRLALDRAAKDLIELIEIGKSLGRAANVPSPVATPRHFIAGNQDDFTGRDFVNFIERRRRRNETAMLKVFDHGRFRDRQLVARVRYHR